MNCVIASGSSRSSNVGSTDSRLTEPQQRDAGAGAAAAMSDPLDRRQVVGRQVRGNRREDVRRRLVGTRRNQREQNLVLLRRSECEQPGESLLVIGGELGDGVRSSQLHFRRLGSLEQLLQGRQTCVADRLPQVGPPDGLLLGIRRDETHG